MRRALLLMLLVFCVSPSAAFAGVGYVEEVTVDSKYGGTSPEVFFRAGAGERNQLTLQRMTDPAADFVLRDTAAALRPGPGCRATDPHTVICHGVAAYLDAGDGDDTVTIAAGTDAFVAVRGGAGADTLTGPGVLAGGPGRDVLSSGSAGPRKASLAGGSGDDVLRGASGSDALSGDGAGPAWPPGYDEIPPSDAGGDDDIDGGDGDDTVTYAGRASNVRVDLPAGRATGDAGEHDTLRSIENAAGGDGDDLLLGDAGANVLEGGSGDDRIAGRGGDDYLLGNVIPDGNEFSPTFTPVDTGVDTLRGGQGDDRLDAGGERADKLFGEAGNDLLESSSNFGSTRARTVSCGAGIDGVGFAPRGQLLSRCERVYIDNTPLQLSVRPVRRGRALRFSTTCRRTNPFDEPCKLGLVLRVRSSLLGRRSQSIPQGAQRSVTVRARRPIRRGDELHVALTVQTYAGSPPTAASWRVRLR